MSRDMVTVKEINDMAKECARINSMDHTDEASEGISCLKHTMGRKIQMYLGLPFGIGAVPVGAHLGPAE